MKKPVDITRRPKALSKVQTDLPTRMAGIYQIARFVQLDQNTVGFFINLRKDQPETYDLEIGTDFCFTRDPQLRKFEGFMPLTQAEIVTPSEVDQKFLMVSYPIFAAFVPLGALLPDGTPHPHAGTGFALGIRLGRHCDDDGICAGCTNPFQDDCYDEVIILQLAWDGERLSITDRETRSFFTKAGEFKKTIDPRSPLAGIVADGEDLLTGLTQSASDDDKLGRAGVCRWKRINNKWTIADFTPIGAPGTFEPSLIRDIDGSLLFTCRAPIKEWTCTLKESPEGLADSEYNRDLRVWQSKDNGRTWALCIHEREQCNACPVSIAMSPAGIPVLLTNPRCDHLTSEHLSFHGGIREKLSLWELNETRTGLLPGHVVRDAIAEFGLSPYKHGWYMDHPVALTVRLSDGKWHSILTHRNLDIAESTQHKKATEFTGLYVEEIISKVKDITPPWIFN